MRVLLLVLAASPAGFAPAAPPDKAPAAPAPAKRDARPTTTDIQKSFDEGDYAGALQLLARVVNLKGAAAAGYDKFELWMLKGESHLRLRQLKPAAEAFAVAARETDDAAKAATARATRRMLLESRAGQLEQRFPPRGQPPQSADVFDPKDREAAMRILYDDARAEAEPLVKAAVKARSLPPIAQALEALGETGDLELAATGGDANLTEAREQVTGRARELISRELTDMQERVESIRKNANKIIERRSVRSLYGRQLRRKFRRGLTERDEKYLEEVVAQCSKIIPAVESIAKASGADVESFEDVIAQAEKVGTLAEQILHDRYWEIP
jgi:hypothetical protein